MTARPALDMAAWVRESRAAQGLPPGITDPQTLHNVAVMLTTGRPDKGGASAPPLSEGEAT